MTARRTRIIFADRMTVLISLSLIRCRIVSEVATKYALKPRRYCVFSDARSPRSQLQQIPRSLPGDVHVAGIGGNLLQDRSDNLEFTQLTAVRRLLHPAKFLVEPEFIEPHQVLKPSSRLDGAPNAFEDVGKLVDGLVLRPVIRGLVTPRRICVG